MEDNKPYYYPNQRVSWKVKQNPRWYKPTVDNLIKRAEAEKDMSTVVKAINAANGHIDKKDFDYVLKPFAPAAGEELESPIDIRGVDFITPIVEKNLGEYLELPYRYMVTVNSEDSIVLRDAACAEAVYERVEEAVLEYAAQMEQMIAQQQQQAQENENAQVPQMPQIDLDGYAKEFKDSWIDDRAINAQYVLDHVYRYNDFDFQRIRSFYYWFVCNEFYTYRHIENDELVREVISPLEGYPISNSEEFAEDWDGFIIKRKISFVQLIENYLREDLLSLEDLKYLEAMYHRDSNSYPLKSDPVLLRSRYDWITYDSEGMDYNFTDTEGELFEYTVIYKTETKVGILKHFNDLGQLVETPVEADYKLKPELGDLELEKTYITEVVTQKRFGDENTGIYTKPVREVVQRYDPATRSCKLPVNGKKGLLKNMDIDPVPIRLLPFQIVDRILLHQMETTMAKYKGAIWLTPQSLIKDDETGTTKEKYFYLRMDGTLIYDDADVDINTINQGFRVVADEHTGKYLQILSELRANNKQDAQEVANMNADRNAQVDTRGNVSNVQQNIYRGKLGSAMLIYVFNKILERDHVADLEYSKYAYLNGLSDSYYDKDADKMIPYTIDTIDILETKFGIYLTNSKLEESKLQFISQQLGLAASQNQDFDIAIEAITVDSIPLLKRRIKEMTEAKRQFESQMREGEMADKQEQRQFELEKIEKVNWKDITVAMINKEYDQAISLEQAMMKLEQSSKQGEGESSDDALKRMDMTLKDLKLKLEERKQAHQERQDAISNRLEEKKIAVSKQKSTSR